MHSPSTGPAVRCIGTSSAQPQASETASFGYLRGAVQRPWRSVAPLICRTDLVTLANSLGLVNFAAEVGVYRGAFSRQNLARWNGAHYWMVDAWDQRQNDTKKAGELSDNNGPESEQVARYRTAKKATQPWAAKRTMLRMYSIPAAARFRDSHFDWIYIDALHTYDAVLQDLTAWWSKLKIGGMMSGDDYADKGDPGYGPYDAPTIFSWGVRSAVNEFARRNAEQVHTSAGNNFFHSSGPQGPRVRSGCHEFQAWYLFKTH